ncbi:PREDICTED: alpha- and gamma-adaptin-binding protein p34-like [Amphimedon queenslandica]|uniref:Alpha-and gamma-adaptin-binding protein p34 n=1 Tax=Amphimedon queenslandica TaxID=400682 RepID=A0A1X7UU31_AMPQE|nr:PREDICTED: alpha- and gamma-adaptin-binding protein p34-like [Amphimedon queenslandica]|eukprot:XP_003386822.1 PREDICTED: alpha- and gamma-adaptin-binding protein p34-like [Amphimedon queenslandica]
MAAQPEERESSQNILRLINCCKETENCLKLIKELTGEALTLNSKGLPTKTVEWHIDNKYYSATINIHLTLEPSEETDTPFEAVVILCELEELDHLERVKDLWSNLDQKDSNSFPPEVSLLVGVTNDSSDENETIKKTLHWCTDNGIELVKWRHIDKAVESDDEEDDNEGISRISEALQAHMWPQITLKGSSNKAAAVSDHKEAPTTNSNEPEPPLPEGVVIPDFLSSMNAAEPDPGGESFEELFERFASMRAHAESLPYEERKAYAEKVVMSFWKSIGGDEEEIDLKDD